MENRSLKILLITQEDPFYLRSFFDAFFRLRPGALHVAGVVICPTMAKKSILALTRQMFDFYGPGDFIRMCWRYARQKAGRRSLAALCRSYGIPVYHQKNINDQRFLRGWRNQGIEVIVSIAAPIIFKDAILKIPRWGCLNIHHAPLPRYRGMMPNFWQMYHGEKNAAITIHRMNEKLDAGEIVLQELVRLDPKESLDALIKRTKREAAGCLVRALEMIRTGNARCVPQPEEKGSYFSFPTGKDVAEFRRRGYRLL